jgi:hypothetical protein
VIRVHAFRILLDGESLADDQYAATVKALNDQDPFVQRTAAEILGRFPRAENLALLMDLYNKTNAEDTHLKYTALLGVRNTIRDQSVMWRIPGMKWTDEQAALMTRAMLDIPSAAAASFVLDYTLTHDLASKDLVKNLEYMGRHVSPYQLEKAIDLINDKFANDPETQLSLYKTIQAGVKQSGTEPGEKLIAWGTSLSSKFLANISENTDSWKNRPVIKTSEPINPWTVSESFLTNVMPAFRIILSEKNGYAPKAVLYSVPFKLPATLKMNVFDNDIHNTATKKGISNNAVRIRLANGKLAGEYRLNQVETSQFKDLIKNATFNLNAFEGQMGYIEVVDSSYIGSIGIGKLEPAVLEIPAKAPSVLTDQRVAASTLQASIRSNLWNRICSDL